MCESVCWRDEIHDLASCKPRHGLDLHDEIRDSVTVVMWFATLCKEVANHVTKYGRRGEGIITLI